MAPETLQHRLTKLFLRWFLIVPAVSDIGSGCRAGSFSGCKRAVCSVLAVLGAAGAGGGGDGGGGCCGLSAVWEVVAQAGAASPCPAGGAGLVAGGQGPPGADLADVGGHQQQRGEDGLGGDAADPAPAWLGEGLVGGVFGVAVEAFDGVARSGALRETMRKLPGSVYRAKGVIYSADLPQRRAVLQVVGRRMDISIHEGWGQRAPRTQVVAIGAAGSIDPSLLEKTFAPCISPAAADT
jgi:Cobalamin synthesis protein cobW C-terminal domain